MCKKSLFYTYSYRSTNRINRNKRKERSDMKPQYENYRYVGEVCRLTSRSVVECRLPGAEISGVLALQANVVATECSCADGEVRYGGKVTLGIVYEDGEKKICRAERGAEFFHKAEGQDVTPACFAKALLSADNVNYRREGSGLYVTIVVEAEIPVYGNRQIEYLTGGDALVCRKETQSFCRTICVSGETEGEDEFETETVGDILLHSENAVVGTVVAKDGQIEVEGELNLNICALTGENSVCSYERLTTFRVQLPCDEAFGDVTAWARVRIRSAQIDAGVDEEKNRSKILFTYCLSVDCFLSTREELSVAVDAFATDCETSLKMQKDTGRYLSRTVKRSERVSGAAVLSPEADGEYALLAAVLPRAELTCRKTEHGTEAEGVVSADVLLLGSDGTHRSVRLDMPVSIPVETDGDVVEADCIVCGLNVRRKKSGETDAEATLKLSLRSYIEQPCNYVTEVTEGAEREASESAFSLFIPRVGEDLWEVSKRLGCTPEELVKSNPSLEFPVKEGNRIFVYRQIK